MSIAEFEQQAEDLAPLLESLPPADRIVVACRGSANPAALAWVAEELELGPHTRVVDVGGGMGGPAAWFRRHYHCPVTVVEPVADSARIAEELGVTAVVADAASVPLDDDAADVALLLGVVSVVPDHAAVFRETHRLAGRLGVLAYCSTGTDPVEAGGSTFERVDRLVAELTAAGWQIDDVATGWIEPPRSWRAAEDDSDGGNGDDPDERAVAEALGSARIAPVLLAASRAGSEPERDSVATGVGR